MPPGPFITGIGLATPLGHSRCATWRALCAGASISSHARVPGIEPDGAARIDVLAQRVAREAIEQAGWNRDALRHAALLVGTSKGPIDAWLDAMRIDAPSHCANIALGLADTAANLATALSIEGPHLTLSAACASGLNALVRAAMMIRQGQVQRALVVAAESSLHPLFI